MSLNIKNALLNNLELKKKLKLHVRANINSMPLHPPQREGLDVFGFFLLPLKLGVIFMIIY